MGPQRTEGGVRFAPLELDAVERRFWRGIWDSVPAEAARERGIARREFGPVQATIVTALPEARMLNLVLGASVAGAADGHLAQALDWVGDRGVSCYVPVTGPEQEAGASEDVLRSHGYERGYAWMKFVRDAHPPRFSPRDDVEIAEAEPGEDTPFGMIAATGFGLPAWASVFFARLPGQPGWHCYVARVDGEAAGCAAMFVDGGIAEFGIAAVLEPARGRGCQLALLHRRIADAAALSCHTLFVETGARAPDRPAYSYRNILKAGFEEAFLRPNWQR